MENTLQFLRNWLPFGGAGDDTAIAAEVQQWLQGVAKIEPVGAAHLLSEKLPRILAGQRSLHKRIRVLDEVNELAVELLPAIEQQVAEAPLPLSDAANARAMAADNLLKALANGYQEVIAVIDRQRLGAGLIRLLRHALNRATATLCRRQMLAYTAYAPASSASWLQLHLFNAKARALRTEADTAGDREGESDYAAALLLAYADPTKYPRSALHGLLRVIAAYAPLLQIEPASVFSSAPRADDEGARFRIRPDEGRPGRPLTKEARLDDGDWVVDCSAVVRALRHDIALREARQGDATEGEFTELSLLRKLDKMWHSQPVRRFNRQRFRPRGDVVSGLADLSRVLSGEVVLPRRDEVVEVGLPAGMQVSEWIISDESPDGFGIRYVSGSMSALEVGQIVGIRPRERSRVHVCQIRRIANGGQGRIDVGLQEIGPRAHVFSLPPATGGRGLFVPRMQAFGDEAGIIVPGGAIPTGTAIRLPLNGRLCTWIVRRHAAQAPGCEILLLEPVSG